MAFNMAQMARSLMAAKQQAALIREPTAQFSPYARPTAQTSQSPYAPQQNQQAQMQMQDLMKQRQQAIQNPQVRQRATRSFYQ